MAMNEGITLAVYFEKNMVRIEATNSSKKVRRLWQQDNSWGWAMPRIRLTTDEESKLRQAAPDSPTSVVLRPALRVWTRNMPTFVELLPGDTTCYRLGGDDFLPEDLQKTSALQSLDLRVAAELHSPSGIEQQEQDVWIGVASSQQERSSPPYPWLQTRVPHSNEERL